MIELMQLNCIFIKIFVIHGLPYFVSGINVHNHLKNNIMKFVKFSVLALSLGIFVASCGNGSGDAAKTDSTSSSATTTSATPPPAAPADTMTAAPAKPADTTAAAPAAAPAADKKMDSKTTETKTTTKTTEKTKTK